MAKKKPRDLAPRRLSASSWRRVFGSGGSGVSFGAASSFARAERSGYWGKPMQAVEANVSVFDQMTDNEQKAMLALAALKDS
jgi:hypothetical protein